MPRFTFETPPGTKKFSCKLLCSKCGGTKADGTACTRTVCIGTDYCWQHLASQARLRIAPSGVAGAGKGLYAWLTPKNRAAQPSDVVFTKGSRIISYGGERVTAQELNARYGKKTAPYGAGSGGLFIDAACQRGAGGMANGSDKTHTANADFAAARGSGDIVIRAKKNIKHGEEVLCSYGSSYWGGTKGTSSRTR